MKSLIEFDYKKATQSINFFARRENRTHSINKMKAIKLIWLADRYHLRKYGRPIVNDDYWAMDYGPVGSSVKDIAESSTFLSKEESTYAGQYLKSDGYHTRSVMDIDHRVFSETDIEALDFAHNEYGSMDQFELADLSHIYPEWKKFEEKLKTSTRERMSYIDFFIDPIDATDDKFQEVEADPKKARDIFKEDFEIAALWV